MALNIVARLTVVIIQQIMLVVQKIDSVVETPPKGGVSVNMTAWEHSTVQLNIHLRPPEKWSQHGHLQILQSLALLYAWIWSWKFRTESKVFFTFLNIRKPKGIVKYLRGIFKGILSSYRFVLNFYSCRAIIVLTTFTISMCSSYSTATYHPYCTVISILNIIL